ncbi:hypothetical protein ACVGWV_14790 [Enterobacter asburiae]
MFNLRVKTWEDWETLCIYWMKEIAWWGHRVDTNYQTYGRPGQKQHGVDIKPVLPGCGIVGQSKFIQGSFTLKDLKEGANKQVISSQADSLIKISRIWADFFPANTSNQPI